MSKKQKNWRNDVVAWAEANVYLRSPETGEVGLVKFTPHQKAWLRKATKRNKRGNFVYRVVVASWPKREGKSSSSAIIAAWRLACFEGQHVGIIANSALQAQSNVFDMLVSIYRDSPALADYVTEDSFRAHELSMPELGNTARVYPANHRTIQGIQFDLICVDELHASEDNGQCYLYASQQTEALDAQVVISSQAGAPIDANPLWRLYNAKAKHILFDYRDHVSTPWGKRLAAEAKAELLSGQYDYLWRNRWGQTGLGLISAEDVEAAAIDFEPPRTREQWEELKAAWGWGYCSIGVGLDRAGVSASGDKTIWTVVARFTPPEGEALFRVVGQEILPTGAEAEILACDRRTREIFGQPDALHFEAYNCSDIVDKCRGATLESPSAQRQQGLFSRLARLFVEGRIAFSNRFQLFKEQLINFQYDAESGNMLKFGSQRGHDDSVYSAAWGTEAADSQPDSGGFSFSFDGDPTTIIGSDGKVRTQTPQERYPAGTAGVHVIEEAAIPQPELVNVNPEELAKKRFAQARKGQLPGQGWNWGR